MPDANDDFALYGVLDIGSGRTFEIRYVMSQSNRVLARTSVDVTSVTASFDVPDTLMVDTPVEIT